MSVLRGHVQRLSCHYMQAAGARSDRAGSLFRRGLDAGRRLASGDSVRVDHELLDAGRSQGLDSGQGRRIADQTPDREACRGPATDILLHRHRRGGWAGRRDGSTRQPMQRAVFHARDAAESCGGVDGAHARDRAPQ
eukprot:2705438-Rhodomonas_salina.1